MRSRRSRPCRYQPPDRGCVRRPLPCCEYCLPHQYAVVWLTAGRRGFASTLWEVLIIPTQVPLGCVWLIFLLGLPLLGLLFFLVFLWLYGPIPA